MGLEDLLIFGALGLGGYALVKAYASQKNGSPPPVQAVTRKPSQATSLTSGQPMIPSAYDLLTPYDDTRMPDYGIPIPQLNPALSAPLSRGNVTGSVLTSPTSGVKTYMDASEAYSLVQKGQYNAQVRGKLISKYFYWKDVFASPVATASPEKRGQVKNVPLQTYKNAQKLAGVLDQLVDLYGKKFPINTWIRMDSTTFHGPSSGLAVDIGEPFSACKKGGALFNAARRISAFKGVGYPTKTSQNALHLDIGARSGVDGGYQFVFVDNGDGNYPGAVEKVI